MCKIWATFQRGLVSWQHLRRFHSQTWADVEERCPVGAIKTWPEHWPFMVFYDVYHPYAYIYIFFISVCVVLEMIYILSYNGHYKYNHCISFVMLIIQCPLRDFSAMLWSPECHTFQSRTMRTMRTMRLSRVSLQSIRSTSGQCGSLKIGPPPRWKNLAQNNSETQICREIGYSKHRGLS